MNDEEMRIAIVGACPKSFEWHDFKDGHKELHWAEKTGRYGEVDLLNDLNAMHEAEKVLPCGGENNAFDRYVGALKEELGDEAICAPPRHRAIAFCRTLFPERFKV